MSFTDFRPDMTEKLLTGTLSLNTTNQHSLTSYCSKTNVHLCATAHIS